MPGAAWRDGIAMTGWTIRKAEPNDAESLGRCIEAAYAEWRITDLPPMSDDCAAEIAENDVWVAETDGDIVGGLILVPSRGFMLLANVAVHPEWRGAGIGRRLLMLAETEATGHGYAEIRLNTHAGMPETIRLYSRNGWTQIGRQGNRITMRKALAN